MLDYRVKQNRKEAFINWFGRSLEIGDCDPSLWMTNYFFDRFEYNTEQRLWLTWLYGNTYYWPTAYIIWNEFPDFELVGFDRLKQWNDENYKRLRYQTDTKWNKGHLPEMFASYKEFVGYRSQHEALTSHFGNDPYANFNMLWNRSNSWYKFGRYSSWFYIQTLKQCCGVNVNVRNLWLHDYNGSRSHRNGICYAVGKDDWIDQKLDDKQIDFLENESLNMLVAVQERYPHVAEQADFFAMETVACSFKKLFRKSRGRYLGYYLDRQAEEILRVENDGWSGIDFKPMWDARQELRESRWLKAQISKSKMELFLNTGNFEEEHSPLEAFM